VHRDLVDPIRVSSYRLSAFGSVNSLSLDDLLVGIADLIVDFFSSNIILVDYPDFLSTVIVVHLFLRVYLYIFDIFIIIVSIGHVRVLLCCVCCIFGGSLWSLVVSNRLS